MNRRLRFTIHNAGTIDDIREDVKDILGWEDERFVDAMAELEEAGLIKIVDQGLGVSPVVYVKDIVDKRRR